MQNLRINVPLSPAELKALVSMADKACRHPREQARFIIREEAQRRGLLQAESESESDRLHGHKLDITNGGR